MPLHQKSVQKITQFIYFSACVYILFLFILVPALAAEKSLVLLEAPLLNVDQNGNASAVITLRNDTDAAIPQLRLNLSDFTHKRRDGRYYPLGTTNTLATVNDKEQKILNGTEGLAKDAILPVKVTVTKLWEAGQSEAVLKNGETNIPVLGGPTQSSIKAIRIPTDYNIQLNSPTPDTPEIHIIGDRALLSLKNSDPFNYSFTWKLRLNGQLFDGGKNFIDLSSNSPADIELKTPVIPEASFLTSGTLKDEIVNGKIILVPFFEGDAIAQPPRSKEIPVTVRLSYWESGNIQQLWNIVCVFILLAVGGVCSLWVHSGMPNTTRALALRRRLRDLEMKIGGLGGSLNSRWRVLLKSHLLAIWKDLFSSWWIFPSFAATLDTLTKKVDMAQQWVEVAYSASLILHDADQESHPIPPTVMRWIQERCVDALTPIESGLTTDDEIQKMKANLNAARKYLALTVDQIANPDLDKEISDREDRLKSEVDHLRKTYVHFSGLITQLEQAVGKPLSPTNYIDRDSCSLRVELLQAFDQRKNQLANAAGSAVQGALERLKNRENWLMTYLVTDTHESLRTALFIVNEMRQDIYVNNALSDEVKKAPPAVTITTDPVTVEARTPVRLALRFNRQVLNQAVARQEWICSWNFGDRTQQENGWEVFHSYESTGKQDVQVMISDLDGNLVISDSIKGTVTVGIGQDSKGTGHRSGFAKPKLEPETKLELGRLVIVLGLALVTLMATARQQAQSLTFLEAIGAVVALGFGADTIKNLILQRSSSG
jgi:hypothetical protein